MISHKPKNPHSYIIVEDARHLFRRCNCTIRHIMREDNKCADLLANMGADQREQLVMVDGPLVGVRSQVVTNMIGTAYRRI
ncbi:hypothetical protein ACSBR2_031277 [Camellia fascicularis]